MTDEQKQKLAAKVMGTCDSLDSALEYLEIDADTSVAEDALLDLNVERCKGCDWWHECCELDNEGEDGEVGYCDQCAKPRDDDE